MTDTELFLIKCAGLFVTTVVGAYLGSYLKKKGENLATYKDIDKLVKQPRVHERQLDILQKLYRCLYDAQDLFKRMTASGRMANEITPEEYDPRVAKAMEAAREEFLNGRLFIPPALVQQCEGFFNAVFEGRLDFAMAHLPGIDPVKRAESWRAAAAVAHQQVPKILQQIEEAARAVIHGEQA